MLAAAASTRAAGTAAAGPPRRSGRRGGPLRERSEAPMVDRDAEPLVHRADALLLPPEEALEDVGLHAGAEVVLVREHGRARERGLDGQRTADVLGLLQRRRRHGRDAAAAEEV